MEIPKTIDEAVDKILEFIEKERVKEGTDFFTLSRDDFLAHTHMFLGRWIRNNWGFWKREGDLFKELCNYTSLSHPDDFSGMLIEAAWEKYHKRSFDFMEASKKYHKHWANLPKMTFTEVKT